MYLYFDLNYRKRMHSIYPVNSLKPGFVLINLSVQVQTIYRMYINIIRAQHDTYLLTINNQFKALYCQKVSQTLQWSTNVDLTSTNVY